MGFLLCQHGMAKRLYCHRCKGPRANLVELLRTTQWPLEEIDSLVCEAADEIERLEAECARWYERWSRHPDSADVEQK